jgi:hypothetical protein
MWPTHLGLAITVQALLERIDPPTWSFQWHLGRNARTNLRNPPPPKEKTGTRQQTAEKIQNFQIHTNDFSASRAVHVDKTGRGYSDGELLQVSAETSKIAPTK